jgi:methylphosphotriester-DNA--protein-cysteine methyltransferase
MSEAEGLAELWFALNHNILEQLQARMRDLEQEGVQRRAIAKRLGISTLTFTRRLRGRFPMTVREMHDLARAMDARLRVAVEPLPAPPPVP